MKDFLKFIYDKALRSSQDHRANFSYNQAVVMQIQFASDEEFGSIEERSQLEELEALIADHLPKESGIDGHEFGESTAIVYIYGLDANAIWSALAESVRQSPLNTRNNITVELQYGAPDKPTTKYKKFTV